MGIIEAVRRLRADVKLSNGQCQNMQCQRILRDDAKPIRGIRACSEECAYQAWLESF